MSRSEKYYAPYLSDSDTGYTSDTSTTSSSSSLSSDSGTSEESGGLQPPDFRQFASGLQLTKAVSTSLSQTEQVLNRKISGLQMAPFNAQREKLDNLYIKKDVSGADIEKTIDFSKQTVTSIVMLDSRDRDKKIYPQPTNLTLRLPRPYKSVTNFQIVQIKLLSSFFYFRIDKNNVDITIHEQGRYLPPGATEGPLNAITARIREGSYNINTLITELTTQLNRTPIFYDYPGGFTQFAPLFASTGDYSLNFNQPGDNYYDALNNVFIQNPTMTQIVQKYFQTLNAGLASYTLDQIKIAYYYPVLKEIILDRNYPEDGLDYDIPDPSFLLPEETVRSRCIYTFQGIDDPIVLQMVDLNVDVLDSYRIQHTFRYSLINKYTISVQSNNNRITITSSQLNTSLTNLLNGKYNQYLAEQLLKYGITQAQYNTLSGVNALLLAILTDMYYYLEKQFAVYFGINFNSYSLPYYTDVNNQIPIQNALNSLGISSNYDAQVIAKNISPQTINELSTFRTPPNPYWNRLTTLSTTTSGFFNMNTNSNISSFGDFGRVYNLLLDRRDVSTPLVSDTTPSYSNFTTSTATIYQNKLFRSADIITNIDATKYTTFRFKSPVRQTLRVAALPRPTKYRYPEYNKIAYDQEHQQIFDNSYAFIENTNNSRMDVLYATSNLVTIPGFGAGEGNFGSTFTTMYNLWTSNITLNIVNNRTYFTFLTPKPPNASPAKAYTYTLNLSLVRAPLLGTFTSPINVYLYHDRAAFMADISDVRNEKPLHYLQGLSFSNTTIGTIVLTAYAQQQYYLLVRSQETSFSPQEFRFVVYYNDTSYNSLTSTLTNFDPLANPLNNLTNFNYASLADSNFLRLPINEEGTNTNDGVDSNLSVFGNNYVKMGYDTNGVSTDLTSYIGYTTTIDATHINPNSQFRIDPISGYLFQANSPYDSNAQQYFGPGNLNQLFTANTASPYSATTIPQRQTTIAQYYDNTFIAPSPTQSPSINLSSLANFNILNQSSFTTLAYQTITTFPGIVSKTGTIDFTYLETLLQGLQASSNPIVELGPTGIFDLFKIPGYYYNSIQQLGLQSLQLGNGVTGISLTPDDGIWDVNKIMLRSEFSGSPNDDPNRTIQYLGAYVASYVNSLDPEDVKLSNAFMVFELSNAITYNSNYSNFSFSVSPGTYYEWIRSSNFIPASNQYLYGYAQQISTMNTDSNSFYTLLPFTSNSTLTTYYALSGTPVPYYPYYSFASTQTRYLDGSRTPEGTGVVFPATRSNPDLTRGPPTGGFPTQAKYEQSVPITNSVLQYKYQAPFYTELSSMKKFGPSTFSSNVGPGPFASSEFRVDGYAMFNMAGDYAIYQIPPSTTNLVYDTTLSADLFGVGLSSPQLVGTSGNESEFAFLTMETRNITPNVGGFLNNIATISSNGNMFAISNSLTISGSNRISLDTITLFPGTYTMSGLVDALETYLNPYFISVELLATSNLKFSFNAADYTGIVNEFTFSFVNYPATAGLLGFYPTIYPAVIEDPGYTLTAPTTGNLIVVTGPNTIPSPYDGDGIPNPNTGHVVYIHPFSSFSLFFDDPETAEVFGFTADTTYNSTASSGSSHYITSPNVVKNGIRDISLASASDYLVIISEIDYTLTFTMSDYESAGLLGFSYPATYTPTFLSGRFTITSPNRVNTDVASTFTHRFQIDTYNPKTSMLTRRDVLTPSNAFYFPPLPSNWPSVLPGYPTYSSGSLSDFDTTIQKGYGNLYLPGTYTASITNVDSFNYTNKGGYSLGYTISYSGLGKIQANGASNYTPWAEYEWWGASKMSSVDDSNTYSYITQPRYAGPNTAPRNYGLPVENWSNLNLYYSISRQKYFDIPENPFGNFHLVYFQSNGNTSNLQQIVISNTVGSEKYYARDVIRGINPVNGPLREVLSNGYFMFSVDFSQLSTNRVSPVYVPPEGGFIYGPYEYGFPIVQPWGFNPQSDVSTLSTLMTQSVFPSLNAISIMDKTAQDSYLSTVLTTSPGNQVCNSFVPNANYLLDRIFTTIGFRGNGGQQELMLAGEAYDMGLSNTNATIVGIPSTTYFQYAGSIPGGYVYETTYLVAPANQQIQSYEGSNLLPYELKTGAKGGFYVTFNEGQRNTNPLSITLTGNFEFGTVDYILSLNGSGNLEIRFSNTLLNEMLFTDAPTASFFGFEVDTTYTGTADGSDYVITSPNIPEFTAVNLISGGYSHYEYICINPVTLTFKTSPQVEVETALKLGFYPYTSLTYNSVTTGSSVAERSQPYASVWGNRNNKYDSPTTIKNAYQIFYPTQRITMTKVGRQYDPLTDLSGILYPEWPHTNMFAYDSYSKYVADISSNKWGLESARNFLVSDTNFSGKYYNASILDIPLLPTSNYYYLAVRGYTPTEKSHWKYL